MGTFIVQSLLGAVRRRLWRGQFFAAARLALWGSVGLMLLAGALHVVAWPVRIDALLAAIAVLWASAIAWAGLRRPSESACALWADRYLGGASAYSTLLEARNGAPEVQRVEAVRWLEQWAVASVPQARSLLAGRRDHASLVRPFVSLLVSTALAALVLRLPGIAPPSRHEVAPPPAHSASRATPDDAAPLAATGLASELASALRSAGPRNDVPDSGSTGQAPTRAPGKSDDRAGSPTAEQHRAPAPGGRAAATESPPGEAFDGAQMVARRPAPGTGFGRDAGDSRDDRADAGVSRALPGSMPVQRRASSAPGLALERQADMDQLATFDDDLTTPGAATPRRVPVAAAATPPPAAKAARLTPTEAAYVQAWLNTNVKR